MFCEFKPHPDTPGRFLCGVCNIPSSRNKTYGPEGPPPRHCPLPPEPRPAKDIDYILETLCPECPTKHYHAETKTCRCQCVHGTPIEFMAKRGNCPNNRW